MSPISSDQSPMIHLQTTPENYPVTYLVSESNEDFNTPAHLKYWSNFIVGGEMDNIDTPKDDISDRSIISGSRSLVYKMKHS